MTHEQLDELMPKAIRDGVTAALAVAQRTGLVAFPDGPFSHEEIEQRVDLCVGAFIAAVKKLESQSSS